MTDEHLQDDQSIVEENANYVLGMYDLYHNDQEVIDALKLKGIPHRLVPLVMNRVKQPAYEKRVRQAKRMIRIGAILSISLFIISILLQKLPGADRFTEVKNGEDRINNTMFHFFSRSYYYEGVTSNKPYER